MSKPKELNFFVQELNWDLGLDLVRGPLRRPLPGPRRVLAPLHEPAALHRRRRADPADNLPDAKLLYMVRDPISRILSHWRHATGAGYETRPMEEVLDPRRPDLRAPARCTGCSCSPTWSTSPAEQIAVIAQEELQSDREATMRTRLRVRRRRRPALHLRAVRPRVGEVHGQGVRPVPVHGEADQAAGLPLLRPQLRPPARAHALDGREGRARPRRPRGAEAGASRPRSRAA